MTLHVTPETRDPQVPLDFVTEPEALQAVAALVHSYGFYNIQAAVVFEPFPAAP